MSIWHYPFVHHALLAGVVTAALAAVVGTIVISRNMAFAVHGLAEVGFTGAAGAVLFGVPPGVGVLATTCFAAVGIGLLGVRLRDRDVAIGTVQAFGVGLGVLFLALSKRYATEAFSILFGSIFAVTVEDLVRSLAVAAVAIAALAAVYRPLRFASVDPEVAEARGVPARLLSAVFLMTLALTVAQAIQVVGVILVFTLLIIPAGTAQRLTAHPGLIVVYSVVIAEAATLGGLACAVYTSLPVSFFVASFAFVAYLLARAANAVALRPGQRSLVNSGAVGGLPVPGASSEPR